MSDSGASWTHQCSVIGEQANIYSCASRYSALLRIKEIAKRNLRLVDNQEKLDAFYKQICLTVVDLNYHFPVRGFERLSSTDVSVYALEMIDSILDHPDAHFPNLNFLSDDEDEDVDDFQGDVDEYNDRVADDDDSDCPQDADDVDSADIPSAQPMLDCECERWPHASHCFKSS